MHFTFNFFYPVMIAFTTMWAAAFNGGPACINTGSTATTMLPQSGNRPRRTRTRVSRSSVASGSTSGRSALRRSARLRQKYRIPAKPILPSAPLRRRTLHGEGAIADIQQSTASNTTTTPITQQLRREDSFILVDYGNHCRMIKPAYAKRFFHSVPEHFMTVAPYHALGASIGEQELRTRLLAVSIPDPDSTTTGTKRVRFVEPEEEGPGDVDGTSSDARPRKRRRSI